MPSINPDKEVLIHLGTEKTGSSFLQSYCAINRHELSRTGIWFATGARLDEQNMLKGSISGGNALMLAHHVQKEHWGEVMRWLAQAFRQADHAQCSRLLLSSELLLEPLSSANNLIIFDRVLQRLGISKAKLLLILRDPADQFLSLYKHRANRKRHC